jgi:hypothetical protein
VESTTARSLGPRVEPEGDERWGGMRASQYPNPTIETVITRFIRVIQTLLHRPRPSPLDCPDKPGNDGGEGLGQN